jgi:polyphosphate kinase
MNNPIDGRLADLDERLFMPRELSWLSFNARVLQEAADENVPIIQRLRYLGIFSSNLDEFFRVRVAEIRTVNCCLLGRQATACQRTFRNDSATGQ